jgi:D-glycero-alpha-D-manno-heptose-7-phosphate kinase
MIISQSPVRITLGGGGTDLPSYYSKYGGALIAAAIDKYTFVTAHTRFDDDIKLNYSKHEIVKKNFEIKHNIFREALKLLKIEKGIELTSLSDMPGSSGLGTSSSFTIALLNVLHTYKKDFVSQIQLAEEACHIEMEILKEPIGKQDQYISAVGGITYFEFDINGKVIIEPIKMSDDAKDELHNNILLFYTGIQRSASEILREQDNKSKNDEGKTIETLHEIKRIGLETKKAYEIGDIDKFGEFLDDHWNIKKKLSSGVSNKFIDNCYSHAIKNGALGGKIMGAGGGGFFMFYHNGNNTQKTAFVKEMNKKGLKKMRFNFDYEGTKIVLNMRNI